MEKKVMNDKSVAILIPEMTIEQYAAHVGVTERTVQGWIDKGYLLSVKISKRRLVNVAGRTARCLEEAD